jgi:hypothetical protein
MIILICSLIIALIAIFLGIDSESQTNQATEFIPLSIPVEEVPLYNRNRNRN